MLITAAEKIKGVYVDSIRPHTGLLEAHRELVVTETLATSATAEVGDDAVAVARAGDRTQA